MTDETGWIIEGGWSSVSHPDYWGGSSVWSSDHMKALRFARRQDAQQTADTMLSGINVRICEHAWAQARVSKDLHDAALAEKDTEIERLRANALANEDEHIRYVDYVGDALGQAESGESLWDAAQRVLSERDRLRVEVERLQAQLASATHVLSLCAFALRQPFDDWKGVHEANALNAINKFAVTRGENP